ncbi:beta strand repeat-containing protein, partial [Novosphingobium beihaiensis]
GNSGGNYTVTANTAAGSIGAYTLTAGLTGTVTKTYDGTTSATLASGNYTLSSGIAGDDVVLNYATGGSYGDKNAGTGKTVSVSGLTLTGGDAGNYVLASTALSDTIGTIGKAALTLSAVTDSKTYDGTASSSGTVTVSGLVGSDTISGLTQSFDTKNAGARLLSVDSGYTLNDGNSGGNYTVTANTAAGSIGAYTLTAGLTGTVTKTYDGTTSATLASGNYTLSSGIAGDDVVLNYATGGSYGDKNAGTGKTVSVSGLTLTAGLTGTVTKTYDGTTSATLASGNYTLSSGIAGDDVVLNYATGGSYGDKNAGTGKTVSVSGLTLTGSDAGNYVLASTALSDTIGTIGKAALTVSVSDDSKTYGDVASLSGYSVSGLVRGDSISSLTLESAGRGADADAGTYAISASGITGTGLPNYTVSYADGTLVVNRRAVTVTADDQSRAFGEANPVLTYTVGGGGLVNGDALSGALTTQADVTSGAGSYAITQGTLSASANYDLTYLPGVLTVTGSDVVTPPDPYPGVTFPNLHGPAQSRAALTAGTVLRFRLPEGVLQAALPGGAGPMSILTFASGTFQVLTDGAGAPPAGCAAGVAGGALAGVPYPCNAAGKGL